MTPNGRVLALPSLNIFFEPDVALLELLIKVIPSIRVEPHLNLGNERALTLENSWTSIVPAVPVKIVRGVEDVDQVIEYRLSQTSVRRFLPLPNMLPKNIGKEPSPLLDLCRESCPQLTLARCEGGFAAPLTTEAKQLCCHFYRHICPVPDSF